MEMEEYIEELNQRKEKARLLGGEKKIALQHELGHLTARERIDNLVDPGSFMELGILNHSSVPGMEEKSPADGTICGIGEINGRTAVIESSDKTVFAGTEGSIGMKKSRTMHQYAYKRGYPFVVLCEGGGLRIPDGLGSDGISERMMPMVWLKHNRQTPFVATVMGEGFGGGAWNTATADFAVQVKGSCMAVAGPRMLEIATQEIITNEELGGWKVHAEITGQIDCYAALPGHYQGVPELYAFKRA